VVTSLAYVAGRDVAFDPEELAAARRRALLIVAAGGDPHRELRLEDRAVVSLADDLDAPAPRAELRDGLARLHADAGGLPATQLILSELSADPELAWRAYVCALLAEELAGE
jgi:hypothetical protein